MRSATVTELKRELKTKEHEELVNLTLRLAKFKKENKELLTYLLFEEHDEHHFVDGVKEEIDEMFSSINSSTFYFIKKSVRKILRHTKKHIRYSKKKETEAALLIHFCLRLSEMEPSFQRSTPLINLFARQITLIQKAISTLHEDLQYDLNLELEQLLDD
ncbi:MAG: hypothetical protein HKN32_05345 [Flavobacteriales bacterium]|nr:hypothetical protein [Flavobacteriales bacterium]